MADHPNKHIAEALDYAESKGWQIVKSARGALLGRHPLPIRTRRMPEVGLVNAAQP